MPKGEHAYIELLLAGALLANGCAGAHATNGNASGLTAPGNAMTVRAQANCPARPLTVSDVRPLVDTFCVPCHSPSGAAGEDYDFRTDAALSARRRNIEAKLRLHVMPPPSARQPSDTYRLVLSCWAKG